MMKVTGSEAVGTGSAPWLSVTLSRLLNLPGLSFQGCKMGTVMSDLPLALVARIRGCKNTKEVLGQC